MGDGTETADFASFRVMCLDEDQLQSTVFKRQQGGGANSHMNLAFRAAELSGFSILIPFFSRTCRA